MSESEKLPPQDRKPMSRLKVFFLVYFGVLFLIGGTIWIVAKIAVFLFNKTIGSSVDGFFANNSIESIVFWAWLIVVGLFIGNVLRKG